MYFRRHVSPNSKTKIHSIIFWDERIYDAQFENLSSQRKKHIFVVPLLLLC